MWSRYWRSGRLETCVVERGDGASPFDLQRLWREHFATYPDGSRLLDLATGNGQVPLIAAETARALGRRFDLTGVDLADVDPQGRAASLGQGALVLRGRVALEALPFPSATFDGATSQFGFEYANPNKAAREMARVLRPGGRGLLVLHHAGSAVTAASAARLRAFEQVLAGGGAARRAERLFELLARDAAPAVVAAAQQQLQAAVGQMRSTLSGDRFEDNARAAADFMDDLARGAWRYDPHDALSTLQDFQEDADAWIRRQRQQIAASLDDAAVQGLRRRLEALDLRAAEPSILPGSAGETLAWMLAFERPAS